MLKTKAVVKKVETVMLKLYAQNIILCTAYIERHTDVIYANA